MSQPSRTTVSDRDEPAVSVETPVPRRINVLILASSLRIGGAEVVIQNLARTIDRRRFNVTVAHTKDVGHIGAEMQRTAVDLVDLRKGSWLKGRAFAYLSFVALVSLVRRKRVDVIHTHNVDGLADAALCKLLVRNVKTVHTFHFGKYPGARWFLSSTDATAIRRRLMWMERLFSLLTDRLISVGDVQRQLLQATYGFRSQSIKTVWNGVTSPSPVAEHSRLRSQLEAQDSVVIGTIATMIEQKGLHDLLHVARIVKDAGGFGRSVKFVVVGEGRLRKELEARRAELGLDDLVLFTGWITDAARVALPAFDVLFQPSLWEAMSVVVLEAMAEGKPVVATRVGENPRVIEHGVDGLLVDATDAPGMAAALASLIQSETLRRQMGQAGRRKFEQYFTVEHMARAYEQIYTEVVRQDLPRGSSNLGTERGNETDVEHAS
jgi:glycosyltransferase involved in cell wall biosynthesis